MEERTYRETRRTRRTQRTRRTTSTLKAEDESEVNVNVINVEAENIGLIDANSFSFTIRSLKENMFTNCGPSQATRFQ